MSDSYKGFYWIAGTATVGLLAAVAVSSAGTRPTPVPVPPSATTMRTAIQGPRTAYPVCEVVADPPCVQRDTAGEAWLITEDGVSLPVTVVSESGTGVVIR